MKYLVIINPESGKKKSKYIFDSVVYPKLKNNNSKFDYEFTNKSYHAENIVKEYDLSTIDAIIILGGDGTMHEVVSGLLKRKDNLIVPIGLLPTGSGNSLLHDLNSLNTNKALDKIFKNKYQLIDVIEILFNEKKYYSINLVGWGMGTDIGILSEKLRWIGPVRYNLASIFKIFTYKAKYAKLIIDGNELSDYFLLVVICNTKHVGRGMKMAPKAILNDGKVDIITINSDVNKFELLKLFPKIFSGKHIDSSKVKYLQGSSVELVSKEDILNIDGELKGQTPFKIKVLNKKIKLLN